MGVEEIKNGASSLIGADLCLEYASEGDSINRDELDRVFTGGLGSRDFGGEFKLEDTDDRGCWS